MNKRLWTLATQIRQQCRSLDVVNNVNVLRERTTFKIPEPCPLDVVASTQRIGFDFSLTVAGGIVASASALEIEFLRCPISTGRDVTALAIFRDWTLKNGHSCLLASQTVGDEKPVRALAVALVWCRIAPYRIRFLAQDLGRLLSQPHVKERQP